MASREGYTAHDLEPSVQAPMTTGGNECHISANHFLRLGACCEFLVDVLLDSTRHRKSPSTEKSSRDGTPRTRNPTPKLEVRWHIYGRSVVLSLQRWLPSQPIRRELDPLVPYRRNSLRSHRRKYRC